MVPRSSHESRRPARPVHRHQAVADDDLANHSRDRTISRVAHRRSVSVLRIAGLPGLRLTVLGRKSEQPRTTNLLCAPYGGGFIVNGSNWGHPKHPAWTASLAAADTAEVVYRGQTLRVRVTQATGTDRARLWPVLLDVWPGYQMEHELFGRDFQGVPAGAGAVLICVPLRRGSRRHRAVVRRCGCGCGGFE